MECAANLQQQQPPPPPPNEQTQTQTLISREKKEEQRMYCIEAAIQTLGSLMAENDEVIETWYLLGCAFQSIASVSTSTSTATATHNHYDASKHYFDNTLQMLIKTKEQMEQQGHHLGIDMNSSSNNSSTNNNNNTTMEDDNENNEFNPLQDIMEKIEDVKAKISEVEQNTFTEMDED